MLQQSRKWWDFDDPALKIKVLDYTYSSEPSINTALPLVHSKIKTAVFYLAVIVSFGFVWLLAQWSAKRRAMFTYLVCSLQEAEAFMIHDEDTQHRTTIVERTQKYEIRIGRDCPSFNYHDRDYIFIEEKEVFVPIRYEQLGLHLDQLKKDRFYPPSDEERVQLLRYYGPNCMKLPVQNIVEIFVQELLTPYEVFQMYGIILWIYEQYYIFAFILLGYSVYTYWRDASQIRKNQETLAFESYFDVQTKVLVHRQPLEDVELYEHKSHIVKDNFNGLEEEPGLTDRVEPSQTIKEEQGEPGEVEMTVVRGKKRSSREVRNQENNLINNRSITCRNVSSQELVPGDIIVLHELDIVPCDCILLRGEALVNERYSTGENYLVRKEEIQNFIYQKQNEKSFLLYLGTEITKIKNIQYRRKVKSENELSHLQESMVGQQIDYVNELVCMVTETNYNTLRGKYLRAIRFQGRAEQQFFKETVYFIYILIVITSVVFFFYLGMIGKYTSSWDLLIMYLDLLADAIPPTLPTILTVGIDFVTRRLRREDIHCLIPRSALTCGKVDTIVLKGEEVFGKEFEIHSAAVGIKRGRKLGPTFLSVNQFESYNDELSLSYNDEEEMFSKKRQKDHLYELGTGFFNALSCCHTLEFFRHQIEGQVHEKKIFVFGQSRNIGQDRFETLNHSISVLKIIRFKEQQMKLGVLAGVNPKASGLEDQERYSRLEEDNEVTIKHGKMKEEEPPRMQQQSEFRQKVIFIKGSAEKILSNCAPHTYPEDAYDYIVDMAEKGFMLYGYAMKEFTINTLENFDFQEYINHVEFTFLGFIIMEPVRLEDNVQAIEEMNRAQVKLLFLSDKRELDTTSKAIANGMCTKNELLLCNVNKNRDKITTKGHTQWQSSSQDFVPEFLAQFEDFGRNSKVSMSSALYEQIFMKREYALGDNLFERASIFNRMELKFQRNIYNHLQKNKKVTCAVGRSGSVSQSASLSLELEKQSSAMLSSFHTKSASLRAIVNCLRICRAGLSTNFHGFSMMILFTLTQFSTVAILNFHYETLTDTQMLYQDLFITFPIFITLYMTEPASKLSRQLPPSSFFSLRHMASMIGQLLIQFFAQLGFILFVRSTEFFESYRDTSHDYYIKNQYFRTGSQLALAIFILSNNLYLGIVLSTSVSKPFRKPFYTNPFYTVNVAVLWLYNTLVVIFPDLSPDTMRPKGLEKEPEFVLVLALVIGNLVMVLMYLYENLLVWLWSKQNPCFKRKEEDYQVDEIREG